MYTSGFTTVKRAGFNQKRYASLISSPNDPKLVNLLTRLEKFNSESKIFQKLDELYLLSQRKGFFNTSANNLEFLSNYTKINNDYSNLNNFNNLNKLVTNQYSNLPMLPPPSASSTSSSASSFSPTTFDFSNAHVPGLHMFNNTLNSIALSRNSPVDKYLKLLYNLAKNDVELKMTIELVLRAFDHEDDYFFNYVLEFWISGKNFNKMKAKKQQDALTGALASNATSI
ncbi:hypothetical protein CANARDRAFT_193280 [[Candida] arabinofermentans NRRL YB-2248]|uniref:Uncharacterized protein n=1 Tax=[Candida] arabinofermentans NRRL YB-2248 TaxID=983967 RepID=A0A1E4T8U2_9ASCO|nr:hypothetical protein CANARDRAFT_193280 [[Candida] arabinofermentans NRRL YB-2248]